MTPSFCAEGAMPSACEMRARGEGQPEHCGAGASSPSHSTGGREHTHSNSAVSEPSTGRRP
eukprot:11092145-Heterocapsa_arctica.AAC.1